LREAGATGEQLGEAATLDDPTGLEHQDQIRLAHGRETVRDHERGAAAHHVLQRLLHPRLGRRIQRAGGFVQDQDWRVLEQRAGDRQALALAAGQGGATLADQRVVAFRLAQDEIVRLGEARGRQQLGLGCLRPADPEVTSRMVPASGSRRRWSRATAVLLPAPVRPTSATVWPASMTNDRS
jgi:hypothetical protein